MNIKLTLAEGFLLLALDNKKGKFLIDSIALNHGLAGAVLMKLTILKKINIEHRRVYVIDSGETGSAFYDSILQYLQARKKPRKVRFWVHKLATRLRKQKYELIDNLVRQGILIKQKQRLLGFIPCTTYPTVDSTPEDELRSQLLAIIRGKRTTDPKSLMLLSLLEATKLTRALFYQRRAYKFAHKRIKALTREFETSNLIHITIKKICAKIINVSTSAAVAPDSHVSGSF